jgi:hypothetical protein
MPDAPPLDAWRPPADPWLCAVLRAIGDLIDGLDPVSRCLYPSEGLGPEPELHAAYGDLGAAIGRLARLRDEMPRAMLDGRSAAG